MDKPVEIFCLIEPQAEILSYNYSEIKSLDEFYTDLFFRSKLYKKYGQKMYLPIVLAEEDTGKKTPGTIKTVQLYELSDYTDRIDVYLNACTFFPYKTKNSNKPIFMNKRLKDVNELCAFVLDIDSCYLDNF